MEILSYIIPISVGIVTIALLAGLWNMMRGNNPSFSQKTMRWRVALQFLAVSIMMAALFFAQSSD